MIELEAWPLCIILFFEEALIASAEGLWAPTCMGGLSQHCVEVRICLGKLRIALFHMLMSGKVETTEVRSHVIQLRAWLLAAHGKSILKWVATDTSIDRVSSLKYWLLLLLKASIIAASCRSRIIVSSSGLLNRLYCHCPGNTSNLRLEIFIQLAQSRFSK